MTLTDLETTALEALGWREYSASITPTKYGEKVEAEIPAAVAAVRELARRAEQADEPRTEQEHRWRNEVRRCQHERDAAEADRDRLQADRDEWIKATADNGALADRYREALEQYADEGNWDTEDGPPFVWVKDSDPPGIARAALATPEGKP